MNKVVRNLKHEVTKVFWVSVYFLIAFGIIMLLKILFLSQQGIEFHDISGIFIGALIMGKVVPLLNHTSLTHIFKRRYLILNVLFKSLLYSLIADLLYFLEHVFMGMKDHGDFWESFMHSVNHPKTNQILIIVLCTFIALFIYNSFDAIDDHLGKKGLYKLFFKRKENKVL